MKNVKLNPWPVFGEDDIAAVSAVLKSGKVNQWTGCEVGEFEKVFCDYVGVPYGIALANGTVALELALQASGIGLHDEVIVPSRTFVGTATAVLRVGGVPVFADVELADQNVSVASVEAVASDKTKALIAVHLAGMPCDLPALRAWCDKRKVVLIEDCAQAHGARVDGRSVGSFGDIACFSFCQDKIMTTGGEGGMLLTSDERIARFAWSFKDHGRDFDLVRIQDDSPGFRYLTTGLGTNWRMTGMQAALGLRMLGKLDRMVECRRRNAEMLDHVTDSCLCVLRRRKDSRFYHSFYKYHVVLDADALKDGWGRNRISQELKACGIPATVGVCPELYLEKVFQNVCYSDGSVRNLCPQSRRPNARYLGEHAFMLQVHPTLSEEQMCAVADNLSELLSMATR